MPPTRPLQTTPPAPSTRGAAISALALKLAAFGFAGGIGFAVDMLATVSMINFGLGPLPARAIGITIALMATYALNRGVTFRHEASTGGKAIAGEAVRYVAVALATSGLNWLVYAVALWLVPGLPAPIAILIGSATAMVVSYVGYQRMVFRG